MRELGVVCLAVLFGATLCWAQDTASVGGQVVDSSGAAIGEVSVTVTNQATRTVFFGTSDANGNYTVADVPAGTYSLRAFKPGFGAYDRTVTLQAGQKLSEGISLSVSAVQQQVVVNGGTQLGATPQPSQSDVFLSDLPGHVLSDPLRRL
jgi:hypothetical protein